MKKFYFIAGITLFLALFILQMNRGHHTVRVQGEILKYNILHERKILVDNPLIESRLTENLPEHIIPVVPYPQEVRLGDAYYTPLVSALSLRISGVEGKVREIITGHLTEAFSRRYGQDLRVSAEKSPSIWIGIPGRDDQLNELAIRQGMVPDHELGDEGYILHLGSNNIYILANKESGVFYGVQTLKLLLRGYPDPLKIPEMTIRDWPAFSFRCVMDDISRGPIPTLEFMKQQVRRYAEMKINHMSFYIEHVIKTETYPDFAPSNGGIPVEEFRELSDYAAHYQIKLVGNFQSLGHFEKILSFPQYRHLGATERMLDPLNPDAINFLENIYREMAPAFSSDFFTPNCDEAWDLSRGKLIGAAD
ncbi:MAG: family 20 glycosylhydrolase, partial [Candidatus Cloacimonetes bacterium]|nr:family 20 glycosylhydrolase [Candidatus Cloacimonadota bacterium]